MYLIHFSVKTLVVLHVEFILIFLESKMATIFSDGRQMYFFIN